MRLSSKRPLVNKSPLRGAPKDANRARAIHMPLRVSQAHAPADEHGRSIVSAKYPLGVEMRFIGQQVTNSRRR